MFQKFCLLRNFNVLSAFQSGSPSFSHAGNELVENVFYIFAQKLSMTK